MQLPPVVALEIGTSKVVALVGEMRDDDRLVVTGVGEHASKGVRKGEVVDLETVIICIRGALHGAEETGQVTIREIHLALSGGHISSQSNKGATRITHPNKEISYDDVEQVKDLARAVTLPTDRDVLHTIWQRFCIDGSRYVMNPVGIMGSQLSLDMLAIHGVRTRLENTINAVQNVPMDVEDVAFSGLCSALAVLSPEQKEIGALVIDLGGGTTDYVAYADKALAATGALGVGGDHVTNDIALAFGIPVRLAETVKRDSGSAIIDRSLRSTRIKLPADVGFPDKTLSVHGLQTVIAARMEESFQMIKDELDSAGLTHKFGAGVIITGGGANMKGIAELARQVFGLPCMIGIPRDLDGVASVMDRPEYSTAVGMIRYGFQTENAAAPSAWRGLFSRLLGKKK